MDFEDYAQKKNVLCIHIAIDGHALNLAVCTTIKQCTVCNDAIDVAFEVTKLIKFSPKRNAFFDRIKQEHAEDESGVGIRSFCRTRWTVRGESIGSILENYNILNEVWNECLLDELMPDIKS